MRDGLDSVDDDCICDVQAACLQLNLFKLESLLVEEDADLTVRAWAVSERIHVIVLNQSINQLRGQTTYPLVSWEFRVSL